MTLSKVRAIPHVIWWGIGCLLWSILVLLLFWRFAHVAVDISERSFAKLMQGPAYAVADLLRQTPEDERGEKLAELQAQFQFPLTLVAREDIELTPEGAVMLNNGLLTDSSYDDLAYYALDDTTVVQFGPMLVSASLDDVTGMPIFWGTGAAAIAPLLVFCCLAWRSQRKRARSMAALTTQVNQLSKGGLMVPPDLDGEWKRLAQAVQQQAAEIASLNERHREVSQSVSHELRTPLSRMRFSLALLARCVDTESRERLQDRLLTDVNELESLVRASLTFSRLAHAPSALARERIDIQDWLEDEIASLETSEHSTSLELHSQVREIEGDRGLLHLVIRNLLTNAVKYGRTQLSVIVLDDVPGRVAIHVDDDGPGILLGDQERVFEPFVRLTQNQSEVQGFGLGLAIVKRAVQWHHGEISVGRSPMGGARFTLTLPLRA